MTAPGEQIVEFYRRIREYNKAEHERIITEIFRIGLAEEVLTKHVAAACERLKKSTAQQIEMTMCFSLRALYDAGASMGWAFYVVNEAGRVLDFSKGYQADTADTIMMYYRNEDKVVRMAISHIGTLFPEWKIEPCRLAVDAATGFPELRLGLMRTLI